MAWFLAGKRDFVLSSTASRPTLGPTQPPIQWVAGALSTGVKRQGLEADHSPPSSVEVKNGGAIISIPNTPSWRGAKLIKYKENFTFAL
jgi:hypothetical protein